MGSIDVKGCSEIFMNENVIALEEKIEEGRSKRSKTLASS